MRETIPSYPDLVHRIEMQIAADKAIEAHLQQFDGDQKRKRDREQASKTQVGRFQEECQNG
ncbi:hypothetical protein KSP40_PGU002002 [Platanthera guangdongensis]|uniref:Uncharacterized protein n=1 Tax=Platanthera guangdongensis TaxID=2320717 RepID=A0ABR2LPX1_9ASPA